MVSARKVFSPSIRHYNINDRMFNQSGTAQVILEEFDGYPSSELGGVQEVILMTGASECDACLVRGRKMKRFPAGAFGPDPSVS